MIRKWAKELLAIGSGAIAFGAIAYASSQLYWITIRETHRAAELVGIMDPDGSLGGQVAGFNYQRHPGWVYSVGQVLGAAVAFGPGMIVALLVMERMRGSWRATICGKCGVRLRGEGLVRMEGAATSPEEPSKSVARCAVCGGEF